MVDRGTRSYARVLAYGADVGDLHALRLGSEAAFRALVDRHNATLMRLARALVRDPTLAEEIVQETWVEVLENVGGFEARSTVKTWLCGVCINTARARLRKEQRTVPLSALGGGTEAPEAAPEPAAVDPSRFFPPDSHWAGHWYAFPSAWPETPEDSALSAELRSCLAAAIEALPASQREVIVLRDVEGFSGEEVCNLLGLSDTHQRVLLHRARSKLRGLLEERLEARPS